MCTYRTSRYFDIDALHVFRSPEQAASFIKKLQSILRRLGASDGDMEKVTLEFQRSVKYAEFSRFSRDR
jgi:Asp-tRNA(Asn)/Glu-tRNA(Gln) amidotransferase B subunit